MARNQTGKPWVFNAKKSHQRTTTYCTSVSLISVNSRFVLSWVRKMCLVIAPPERKLPRHRSSWIPSALNIKIYFNTSIFSLWLVKMWERWVDKLLSPPNFLDFNMDLYFTAWKKFRDIYGDFYLKCLKPKSVRSTTMTTPPTFVKKYDKW